MSALLMTWLPWFTSAQGLINNGATITISNGTYVYIDGGTSVGNVTNQDAGGFSGTVDNQGFIDVTGDWNNLSTLNVFNASTGTVRLLGANQFIQGTTPTYFNNLTLLGSGVKTLNIPTLTGGGFAVPAGILDLTTLPLDLNAYQLTVNNAAPSAITNTTGYIISETPAAINPSIVQWNMGVTNGIYVYPFGVAGTQIPFTLNKTAGAGNVSVSTRATALSNNTLWQASVTNMYSAVIAGPGEVPVVIDRWWDVDPSGPVTGQLSFTYRGSENTTTYNPTGTFSAQNWNSLQWLPPVGAGPGVLVGTASVTTPGQLLSTTPWVLSNLDAPLPIELLSFTGICDNQEHVRLNWITASEKNNRHFLVEKSMDGFQYDFLTSIVSQGNASHSQYYSFVDAHPFKDLTYYRLSQTDLNGRTVYFDPIRVKGCSFTNNQSINAWSLYDGIHLLIKTDATRPMQTCLYDALGRMVFSQLKTYTEGVTEDVIPTTSLSKGIYLLNMQNDYESYHFKLIISK